MAASLPASLPDATPEVCGCDCQKRREKGKPSNASDGEAGAQWPQLKITGVPLCPRVGCIRTEPAVRGCGVKNLLRELHHGELHPAPLASASRPGPPSRSPAVHAGLCSSKLLRPARQILFRFVGGTVLSRPLPWPCLLAWPRRRWRHPDRADGNFASQGLFGLSYAADACKCLFGSPSLFIKTRTSMASSGVAT